MIDKPTEIIFGIYTLICIGYTTWRIIHGTLFHPIIITFIVEKLIHWGVCPKCGGKETGCAVCRGFDLKRDGYPDEHVQRAWKRRFIHYMNRKESLDDAHPFE